MRQSPLFFAVLLMACALGQQPATPAPQAVMAADLQLGDVSAPSWPALASPTGWPVQTPSAVRFTSASADAAGAARALSAASDAVIDQVLAWAAGS